MKKENSRKTTEDLLFYIGIIAGICFAMLWPLFLKAAPYISDGCRFYALTGFYCPACGGTRAVNAFLSGHLVDAIWQNAAAVYMLIMYSWFMTSQAIDRFSRRKIRIGLMYRNCYVYIGIILMLIQWAVKNIIVFLNR